MGETKNGTNKSLRKSKDKKEMEKKLKLNYFFDPYKINDEALRDSSKFMKFSMDKEQNVDAKNKWKKISNVVFGKHPKIIKKLKRAKRQSASETLDSRMNKFFQNGFLNVRENMQKRKSSARKSSMKVNPSTKSSSNVNMDKFKTTVLGNKIPEQKQRYSTVTNHEQILTTKLLLKANTTFGSAFDDAQEQLKHHKSERIGYKESQGTIREIENETDFEEDSKMSKPRQTLKNDEEIRLAEADVIEEESKG